MEFMAKFNNWLAEQNAYLINKLVLAIGIILILLGFFFKDDYKTILISVGCSLIASGIVVLLSSKYLIRMKKIEDIINNWGLEAIFTTRQEMNLDSDDYFPLVENEIDIIAFGLESFRNSPKSELLADKIKKGLKVRIITMSPQSELLAIRDQEEGKIQGSTAKTINDLGLWVRKLSQQSPDPQNVQIKYYDSLPLDFYWRQDNYIYTGPYMYGKISQQTISFKFKDNSRGFEYYQKYFDDLWNNQEFCRESQ